MGAVSLSFIIVQSFLELGIFITFVLGNLFSQNRLVKLLSYLWVFQYFQIFATYTLSAYLDPGYLKHSWIAQVQNDPEYKEELAENGEKNFCKHCVLPRPLRCHHCSECHKCVLLFDHHCFFVDNCVGFRNFKVFFQFLCVFPVHAVLTIVIMFYNLSIRDPDAYQMIFLMLGVFYFFIFGFFVVAQLIPQIGFLIHNSTWVEDSMRTSQKSFYEKAKVSQLYAYDNGFIFNLKCRLGNNPLFWLLPTPNTDNPYKSRYNPSYTPINKLSIPLIDDLDENAPLLQKYTKKRNVTSSMV